MEFELLNHLVSFIDDLSKSLPGMVAKLLLMVTVLVSAYKSTRTTIRQLAQKKI